MEDQKEKYVKQMKSEFESLLKSVNRATKKVDNFGINLKFQKYLHGIVDVDIDDALWPLIDHLEQAVFYLFERSSALKDDVRPLGLNESSDEDSEFDEEDEGEDEAYHQ